MKRVVHRKMPDGNFQNVQPFHVSMEGLEKTILCRCDNDYDAMVKILCICARRKNVLIIVYAVVSNHCHVAVLAVNQADADAFGQEVKRMYAMWFSRQYGEQKRLQKTDVKAICLDNDWYVRNALRWSAYRAMFCDECAMGTGNRQVASLTKVERRKWMHTGDSLKDVAWRLDAGNSLIPASFCDREYLEQAFEHDQAFFLKTIGGQNASEMQWKLIEAPRKMLVDSVFYKSCNEISQRWFQAELADLSIERKTRLIPYLKRTMKTTVPQLARTMGLSRNQVSAILGL